MFTVDEYMPAWATACHPLLQSLDNTMRTVSRKTVPGKSGFWRYLCKLAGWDNDATAWQNSHECWTWLSITHQAWTMLCVWSVNTGQCEYDRCYLSQNALQHLNDLTSLLCNTLQSEWWSQGWLIRHPWLVSTGRWSLPILLTWW